MATSNLRKITADAIQGVQAPKNYISNGNFENNTVTNWSLFNTTLTSGVPTGTITSGAASLTLNPTSSNVLFDGYSMQIVAGSAWTAGQGFISDAFTVDRGDLGKVLTFKFYYQAVSGGLNANWSGILGSQSLSIYIYDATVGAWIQPTGFLGMNQNSGAGYVTGTFQSSVTVGQQYRIAILGLQTTSGAITVNFDNFVLNSQTSPVGSAMTDWQSYTPTLSGFTTSAMNALWRRVGDSVEIIAKFTKATHSASEMRFGLPPGLTSADTSKIPSIRIAGDNVISNANTPATTPYVYNVLIEPSVTYLTFGMQGTGNQGLVKQNANNYFGATDILTFQAKIPIAGWGSFSQMSSDTDTRVIVANCAVNTGTSVTAATPINFDSVITDNTGSVSPGTGTWKFTAPVSGFYEVSTSFATGTSNNVFQIFKNNSVYRQIGYTVGSAGSNFTASGSTIIQLNAGEYIDIRPNNTQTLTVGLGTGGTVSTANWISINRLSGPSVITATETVAYRGGRNGGNYSLSSGSSVLFIPNSTMVDTHNAMNTSTGIYTIPVSGIYEIIGRLAHFTTTGAGNINISITAGSEQAYTWNAPDSANNNYRSLIVTMIKRLNAGDTVSLYAGAGGVSSTVVGNDAATNGLSIKRIGS